MLSKNLILKIVQMAVSIDVCFLDKDLIFYFSQKRKKNVSGEQGKRKKLKQQVAKCSSLKPTVLISLGIEQFFQHQISEIKHSIERECRDELLFVSALAIEPQVPDYIPNRVKAVGSTRNIEGGKTSWKQAAYFNKDSFRSDQ